MLFSNDSFRGWLLARCFRMPGIGSALAWSASQKFASTLRLYVASNVAIANALPVGPEQRDLGTRATVLSRKAAAS